MAVVVPTEVVLPADTRIPSRRKHGPATGRERQTWHKPYVSRFLQLEDDVQHDAWFHFCHGHHVEFIYWEATALACEQATAASLAGDGDALAAWVGRVARLNRGSGALLHFCGQVDGATYDMCLRTAMKAERDDFSGDMSRDFLAMAAAKAELTEALSTPANAELLRAYHRSEQFWMVHHGQVVRALHPGHSLLKEKLDALEAHDNLFDYASYVEGIVHGDEALADYDDYFGVRRSASMTVDDYWTQAVEKLAVVHRQFVMDAPTREALMLGDATLLEIISLGLEKRP